MSWWKIGFHLTSTGNMDGIGDYIQALRDNDKPVSLQSVDAAGVIYEAAQKGSHPQDALVFRRATGNDPNTNTKIDRLPESNETYTGNPTQIAASRWQLLCDMWPPELDPTQVWTVTINEPSKEPQNFDYLGQYAIEEARLAIEQNRKVLSFGFSGGTPSRAFWESEYVLQYLQLCAEYPDNVGISLHEYSFDGDSLKTGYPYLLGRFQELHDVCDQHGINRPTIILGEFGAGESSWNGTTDHKMSDIQWAQDLYEPYGNILGACAWTLGEWGGTIVNDVLSLVEPITDVAKDYPYSPPDEIEPQPPIKPPVTTTQLFKVDYTGWGEADKQEPVGWYDSNICVNVQVPYAIFPEGRYPMEFENFEGNNPYGDGESWNDFTCPEAVVKWADLLPPNEDYYLNEEGRTQHWFCPAKAGRSRFKKVVNLDTGTYRLTLDAYGDFAQFENGQKIEQHDPQHGQVELFIGTNGIDEMIDINLIGDNHITKEFTVDAGEYEVGFGLLSRWAAGGGTAGFFLQGFEIELVSEPVEPPIEPPVNAPKIVIVKKPQITDITYEENIEVAEWSYANYGRTTTHSTDDMLSMLRSGNEESYAVVWWRERQPDTIDTLIEEGFEYILMPEVNDTTILNIPHMAQFGGDADARSNDCGAACCAMIINGETDNNPTVDDIATVYQNPANSYMSFNQLDLALNGHEMNGIHQRPSYSQDMADDVMNGKASIALVWYQALPEAFSSFNGTHFVVVYGVGGDSLYYHDPLCPDSRVTTISFEAMDNALFRVNEGGNYSYQTMVTEVKDVVVEPPTTGNVDVGAFMKADPYAFRVVRHSSGSGENIQDMDLGNGLWVRAKNSNAEWWGMDSDYAYLVHDTSPSPQSDGTERVYTLTTNGAVGSKKNPLKMSLNHRWNEPSSHYVQFRAKSDCRELSENSGSATNYATLVTHEYNKVFNSYGQNIVVDEYIELETSHNEFQGYAKKDGRVIGWCSWRSPWGSSEITELYWDRGKLEQEPNRYCNFE